jgi:hypothetical protein
MSRSPAIDIARFPLALLAAACLPLGCTAEADFVHPEDGLPDFPLPQEADDGALRPVGTFVNPGATPGELSLLVLRNDETFRAETAAACIDPPCASAFEEGTYVYTASGAVRYVRLAGPSGAPLRRYAYEDGGARLRLRPAGTDAWIDLERGAAWCEAAYDCTVQDLVHPLCAGSWTCRANACAYECRTRDCVVTGCSDQVCSDRPIGTTCERRPEHACFRAAECGTYGPNGSCAWRATPELAECLAPAAAPTCAVDSGSPGWLDPLTGESLCAAACAHCRAECRAVGTSEEGWYASCGDAPAQGGCGDGALIVLADCG